MEEKKLLDIFEIGNEISSLVAKGELTPSLGEKIKEKIKEKGVSLTKDQLHELIRRTKSILKSHSIEEKEVSGDLLQVINDLRKRVEQLEKAQDQWMKGLPELRGTESRGSLHPTPLSDIPNDPKSVVIAMKWLQFLINKVGVKRVPEVLNYYVDIGWLDEKAKSKLLVYCEGLGEEGEVKEGNLTAKDHLQSFLFIQKLLGKEIGTIPVDQIDRDISKVMKNLENMNI